MYERQCSKKRVLERLISLHPVQASDGQGNQKFGGLNRNVAHEPPAARSSERAASLDYLLSAADMTAQIPALTQAQLPLPHLGSLSPAYRLQQQAHAKGAFQPALGGRVSAPQTCLPGAFQPLAGNSQTVLPIDSRHAQLGSPAPPSWPRQGPKKAQVVSLFTSSK